MENNIIPKTIEPARPVTAANRIQTIDTVRGFALLGILLMNMPGFGIDNSAYLEILRGSHQNKDFYTVKAIIVFFDGTMRGLFSMLFGAGMILFTLKKDDTPGQPGMADYYYRRLLWLILFGLFNAYILLWPGDILFFYGVAGLLLFVFRNTKPIWLITLGIACIAIGNIKNQLQFNELRETRANYVAAVKADKEKKEVTPEQQGGRQKWEGMMAYQSVDTARTNENVGKIRGGYATVFSHFVPENSETETWGVYHGSWDVLCAMFIGMALFRLGFFSNKLSTSTYALLFLIGYGIGIPLGLANFNGILQNVSNFGHFVDSWRVPLWSLYDFRRLFIALGHASLLMLVFRSGIVPWLMRALSNVGQMAFTNYLSQSIICTLIYYGYGLGYYNKLRLHELYYVVFAIWIFQLIVSTIWLKFFRFGPFEWVWRSLTYWKPQPMKKHSKS